MKQTLAVIGMGMMGGSLGSAVKKRRLPYHVLGIGRSRSKLLRAKNLKTCDEITVNLEDARTADIVVICTSLKEIVPTFQKILPYLKPGAAVTDIGSVKSPIVKAAESAISNFDSRISFIGGHPMAGSEKTGVENSSPDLYVGATVVLCPLSRNEGLQKIESLWRGVGAQTIQMDPSIHDILVAQTSHLPHVLSAAFVQLLAVLSKKDKATPKLLAGSFRDFTRITDSDPKQWAEIASSNQKFVIGALKSYRDILQSLIQSSSADPLSGWESFFERSRAARRELLNRKASKA